MALTTLRQQFLAIAQINLEQFDSAVFRIGRSGSQANESISLGATPEVAADILPQAIKEFRGVQPQLRIESVS